MRVLKFDINFASVDKNVPQRFPILQTGLVPNPSGEEKPIKITVDMLKEVLRAFKENATGYEPDIHIGHPIKDETGKPIPEPISLGFIKDLELEENGSEGTLFAIANWNDKGKQLVLNEMYRYPSVEIAVNYLGKNGKRYKYALKGLGLTNQPAAKVPPIKAAESQLVFAFSEVEEEDAAQSDITAGNLSGGAGDKPRKSQKESLAGKSDEGLAKEVKMDREELSKKYGIALREDGNTAIPEGYEKPEDFADPVNFRFPITDKEKIEKTITRLFSEDVKKHYPSGFNVIVERAVKAAVDKGVEVEFNPIYMSELPQEILEKTGGYKEYMDKLKELEEKLKALEEEKSKLEEELKKKEEKIRLSEVEKEVESLMFSEGGKAYILPSEKEKWEKIFLSVPPEIKELLIELLKSRPALELSEAGLNTEGKGGETDTDKEVKETLEDIKKLIEGGK